MAQLGGRREPTFFWQGALILLPVAGLVIIGFLSLRQDRVLAGQQAVQRANDLARELGPQLWRELTSPGTNELGREFLVNSAGQLVIPPPFEPNPVPQPLELATLPPDTARLWQTARQSENGADVRLALNNYRQFLAAGPPRNFAAMAHYALALLLLKANDTKMAAEQFEIVRDRFPALSGESGLRMGALAEFKLLELSDDQKATQIQALEEVCSNLVWHPTAVSQYGLGLLAERARAPEMMTAARKWEDVWGAHTFARELFGAAQGPLLRGNWVWFAAPGPESIDGTIESWLAIPIARDGTNIHYLCHSESE